MKMSEEIIKRLHQIVKEVKPSINALNENSNLHKDLGLDSLDTISFFFEVEKAFDIKIPESDITENLFNIGKIIKYIEKRVNNI